MNTSAPALRIAAAVLLLGYALVEALRCIALLASPELYPTLAHGLLAVLAGLAGAALWLRSPRAPVAIVALGAVFAVLRLIDALVLGIRPWLFALLTALLALATALLLASWAARPPATRSE
jgi:hypothetical protein